MNDEEELDESRKRRFSWKTVVMAVIMIVLCISFVFVIVLSGISAFLSLEVKATMAQFMWRYAAGNILFALPLGLFVHCALIILILIYILRWIHLKVEKYYMKDKDHHSSYNSLLAIFNLEKKARKHGKESGVRQSETEDIEMGSVTSSEDTETDDTKTEGSREHMQPFISESFCRGYRRLSTYVFSELHYEDENPISVEDTRGIIKRIIGSIRVVISLLVTWIGSTSELISLISWILGGARALNAGTGESANVNRFWEAAFFSFAFVAVYLLGLHVSIPATIPHYFSFYRRSLFSRKGSKDEASDEMSVLFKILLATLTAISIPLAMIWRLFKLDTLLYTILYIVNSFFRSAEKRSVRMPMYRNQMFFWQIGKVLPNLFVQTISVLTAIHLILFEMRFGDKDGVTILLSLIIAVMGIFSLITTCTLIVMNLSFWNWHRYPSGIICKVNFVVLQISSIFVRVLFIATAAVLTGFVHSIRYEVTGNEATYAASLLFFLGLIPFFTVSIVFRLALFLIPGIIFALRKVRLLFAPLYVVKLDDIVEAIVGSMGAIVNANPSAVFLINIIVSSLEGFTGIWINIALSSLTLAQEDANFMDSLYYEYPFSLEFFSSHQFIMVHCIVLFVYISSAIFHILSFPMYRNKNLSFGVA